MTKTHLSFGSVTRCGFNIVPGRDTTENPHHATCRLCRVSYWSKARLHEAGPIMLEALENLENDDGRIPPSAWNLVRKALSAAGSWRAR